MWYSMAGAARSGLFSVSEARLRPSGPIGKLPNSLTCDQPNVVEEWRCKWCFEVQNSNSTLSVKIKFNNY